MSMAVEKEQENYPIEKLKPNRMESQKVDS